MRARVIDLAEVEGHDEGFAFCHAGLGKNFARGAGDKALAPELDTVAGQLFMAHTVRHSDVAAVGNGVGALDRFPGGMLPLAQFRFLARMPADGGGAEQNLRASQCRQARGFWIPLVPADQHADLAVAGLPGAETEVAWSEIELLVIQRGDR